MKKLVINAANVCILKNDADFFSTYDRIVINTAGATISREAYTEMSKHGLVVNSAGVNIIDIVGEVVDIGNATISTGADYSGKYLIGGKIKVTSKEALNGMMGISAQAIIVPEGTRFDYKVSGKVYYYPEGAVIADGDIEINKNYVAKLEDNTVLWTSGDVIAFDSHAAEMLRKKDITVCCGNLLITEGIEQQFGKCFKTDSREVIPDGCQYIKDDLTLSAINTELFSEKLYVAGDLTVIADAADVFDRFSEIIVTGNAIIPHGALTRWKEVGRADKVTLYKGELWSVCGNITITHEQLEAANEDGMKYTLVIDGNLTFDADVTKADFECLSAIYYDGKISMPAKVIPVFNSKLVEGDGSIVPLMLAEDGKDAATDRNDGSQVINVASFVRV